MGEDKFDCIVVGGGVAGLTAAYIMAQEGLAVLVIERGDWCGAKNMTGGRLYTHTLEAVMPGFAAEAPLERKIVKDRLSVRLACDVKTAEYSSAEVKVPEGESYSVLRSKFDRWLADKVEEAGAMIATGIVVDDLLVRDGRVCGIIAGEDEMEADVVCLADGVNSLLGQKLGIKKELTTQQAVVGVKELVKLPPETINERFGLEGEDGMAWMFLKCCEDSNLCDGFLYTNKDSISYGVNLRVSDVEKTQETVAQMMEDFRNSEWIAPLIEGGRMVEYSAHLIPEGGVEMMPEKLSGDGWMILGDAAAMCANFGFSLHGMDLAVESGCLAAETIIAAQGDCSAKALAAYDEKVHAGFIAEYMNRQGSCMETIRNGAWMEAADVFNKVLGDV